MNTIRSHVDLTAKQLNRLIGGVTVNSLFSGYGFYQAGHMFGIMQNSIFYLRAEDELARLLERHGALPCPYSRSNLALSLSRYYHLPAKLTEDDALYKSLILQSIEQVKQQKIDFQLAKKTRIKELCNLSIKHERLLVKINIHDVIQLQKIGAEMAYIRAKKQGFSVTLDFYWNLVAALKNLPISLLPAEKKAEALAKLNDYLRKEGMRSEKG
ncbi:hypothetical protein OA57_00775 [Chelonobacter oris]|uniref:DNA transformation protein n=1 Tax=Chelonobacter oris TaxID=505317 RepID=A0A0A3APS8_9PAST|nr:TfoX/Sxy family DNA transformation protein [Chelonobacter oris]KGQ71361.1 hypothetical protein OA57_00775 [Chelonobacter oris]